MEPARVTELRLTDFKSFRDEVLPLGKLTVLIGGNAVGKSNALEGLYALSRLAERQSLRQAFDGAPGSPSPIRGGLAGCAPLGLDAFTLGASARNDRGVYGTEITVRTEPTPEISRDHMFYGDGIPMSFVTLGQPAFASLAGDGDLPKELEQQGIRDILQNQQGARELAAALREVFILDPEPRLMRGYAARQKSGLLSDGSNLSSTVRAVKQDDPEAFRRLETLIRTVTGGRVDALDFVETEIRDVQLLLRETAGPVPARLASDGTLRILAFGAALAAAPPRSAHEGPERRIVIEEIERGLYPAQARTLLELIVRELPERAVSVLLTTHSPALLEALPPERHPDVIVCSRDPDSGSSRLHRLTELPGYPELIAAGGLGEAVTGDGLEKAQHERRKSAREFFDFLESM